MKFHELGDKNRPHIMLIHGGGNSWWNYLRQARALAERYHVILPTLDGHGEEHLTEYVSTEDTADKLMDYIEGSCGGRLFLLGGVSLGGQIVMELLARKPELTEKAIIDGSICSPQPGLGRFSIAAIRCMGGLMFSRNACRFQLWVLRRFLPEKMRFTEEMEAYYMRDMPHVRRETLYAIYRTYMMDYTLKAGVRLTKAQVSYWYGEKEMKCVKKSAAMFRELVPSCEIVEAKGYDHGYLAIYLPEEWLERVKVFCGKSMILPEGYDNAE